MSAANAVSSDQAAKATLEARTVEPSMEDILASIRRIIADDQSRVLTTSSTANRRAALNGSALAPAPAEPVVPAAPPALGGIMEQAPPRMREAEPLVAAALDLPVPHLNPPLPEPTEEPAQPMSLSEEHLSAISAIAEAGIASILAPEPARAEPSAYIVAAAPLPQSEAVAPIAERTLQPEAPALPDDAEVLALNGYEAPAAAEAREPPPEPPVADPLLSDEVEASIESSFQALATSVFLRNAGPVDAMVRDMLRPMLKSWLDDNLPPIVERLVRIEIQRVARGNR